MRYLIGLGNYMQRDDAIGIRVVEEVVARGLDTDFRAIDLSANCLNLVAYLDTGTQAILVVDSAKMGLAAGEYRVFAPDEVQTHKSLAGFSTHEGDLLKVLELARELGYPIPRLAILGIEPENLESGAGLSASLQGRLEQYVAVAVEQLRGL